MCSFALKINIFKHVFFDFQAFLNDVFWNIKLNTLVIWCLENNHIKTNNGGSISDGEIRDGKAMNWLADNVNESDALNWEYEINDLNSNGIQQEETSTGL